MMDYEKIGRLYAEWYRTNVLREQAKRERGRQKGAKSAHEEYKELANHCGSLKRQVNKLCRDGMPEVKQIKDEIAESKKAWKLEQLQESKSFHERVLDESEIAW